MNDKIWLSSPHMSGNELKYVNEAYDTNWIAPLGHNVDCFEKELGNFLAVDSCVALSSGTAALHLALVLTGVSRGDYVICQSMTFAASANPITYLGANPVFVDSEKDTWNIDPVHLESAILDLRKKFRQPKAIVIVHLYGMPANLDALLLVARKYDIPIIEDAAESLGSRYKGKATGTFGKMGILSFNGNKIITTSGGGALTSEEKKLVEKARFLATQARDRAPHYEHSHIGYNYRMSNVLAGIGRGQMQVLDDRINQRRGVNKWYREILSSFEGITFQDEPSQNYYSNYWLTAILINEEISGISREHVRASLLERNIESRPLWKPLHLQPVFQDCLFYGTSVSEKMFEIGLCLPSGSNLQNPEKDRIADCLMSIFSHR